MDFGNHAVFQIMSNGDEQLEKAMEEILRDSEKKQNIHLPADDGAAEMSAASSTFSARNPPLTLVLDPNNTGQS